MCYTDRLELAGYCVLPTSNYNNELPAQTLIITFENCFSKCSDLSELTEYGTCNYLPTVPGQIMLRFLLGGVVRQRSRLLPWRTNRIRVLSDESFLNSSSSAYIEGIYEAWLKDASSVHKV